jgi:hypothetical protein
MVADNNGRNHEYAPLLAWSVFDQVCYSNHLGITILEFAQAEKSFRVFAANISIRFGAPQRFLDVLGVVIPL